MSPMHARIGTVLTLALTLGLLPWTATATEGSAFTLADPSSRAGEDDEALELPDASPDPAPIVHGEITSEWPATAALLDRGAQFCTGTLIAPTVVLTAAHCLEEGAPEKVFFGDNPSGQGERIAVADILIHPDYDAWAMVDAADVGLVFLSEAASAPPVEIDRSDAPRLIGSEIRYVGFGSTEGTGGEGFKKQATATIEDIDGDVLVVRPDDGSACWGDSGGPLYREMPDGSTLVTGVVSFGYTDDCMDLGGNTRTDVYADWIAPYLGDNPGPIAGNGTTLHRPDGIEPAFDQEHRGGCSTVGGGLSAPTLLSVLALVGLVARRRRD